jgi:hypothetical protein
MNILTEVAIDTHFWEGPSMDQWTGLELVWWAQLILLALGYVLTLGLSGYVVRYFVSQQGATGKEPTDGNRRFDPGAVIGKSENLITLTLILLGEYAGLAIIFAAKSIVRRKDIEENASWYLGGTLINLVFSAFIALLMRILIFGWPVSG